MELMTRNLGRGLTGRRSAVAGRRWVDVLGMLALGLAMSFLLFADVPALAEGGFVPALAEGEGSAHVLVYTGTTGYRHADAIDQGVAPIRAALEAAGLSSDLEDCNGHGTAPGQCRNAEANPRVFTPENLSRYDAILLFNVSDYYSGTGGAPGQLWNAAEREAIRGFVNAGGGITANHNATDMGAGQTTWDWWDGGRDSAVGTLMAGHAATSQSNVATVQVADRAHPSTAGLPDTYGFGDEHYNFVDNVRGTHHVLATLDERTYDPGGNAMGQDHPISWCKRYDGGRVWLTGMGHFGASYTANGGDNELVDHLVGGVSWAAGAEGRASDCGGTVWSNFTRTILVDDVNGPMAVDVAADGKVYWTEIGSSQGYESEGYVMMHDPQGEPNNATIVATIPTRADHGNSEDGVLGMSLEPGFDLSDPATRDIYVLYSPRGEGEGWPTSGDQIAVGYNLISRFTLTADGTAVVPGSEREILRIDKAKIAGSPFGDSGPGHVGSASLVFDSEGNLYTGTGDDVSPNASGHNRYVPMDHRRSERWDARKTSANTGDLRGKILRIRPLDDIAPGTLPGEGTTYAIPDGNMFDGTEGGGGLTRREIYAMGFRQPFTVHTDPANPGTVVTGEYCHDNNVNQTDRAPAGTCEWNLIDGPAFHGWPFCMGDNAPINTTFRWNYTTGTTTGEQYDCALDQLPSDLRWAPIGGEGSDPTHDGLDLIPGPAAPATIWKKYPGAAGGPSEAEFGDLSAGGMQPVTGPIYRYDDGSPLGAFPSYYDGSWLITNRGANNGFWKEVRLRSDDNQVLRVHDFLPVNNFGTTNSSYVIGTRFGPDGALYMGRWTFGCCRNQLNAGSTSQLFKIEFVGDDEVQPDTTASLSPAEPGPGQVYERPVTVTLSATDDRSGVDTTEYRVDGGAWTDYDAPFTVSSVGQHVVEYRSLDNAGTMEATSSIEFTIEAPTVLIYTGTTGYRHSGAINDGIGPITAALDAAGFEWVHEDCDGVGGAVGNCDHPDANPRIFTPENLEQFSGIFLFNASSRQQGAKADNVLWDDAQRAAIVQFVNNGGGIAANHNSVDMGHASTTWDWWDGPDGYSAVGTVMPGHAASTESNLAPVDVEDHAHPSTEGLQNQVGALAAPQLVLDPVWVVGDEHYNFTTNVRGAAHILATLDESAPTYNPGGNAMGEDHPISWCKPYDGGRVWLTGIGHFGSLYTSGGGDNNVIRHLVGGIAWASGAVGFTDDCDYEDTLAPRTTHALDPAVPDGEDGTRSTPPEVTLTAVDDTGHTAAAGIVTHYRFDGGAWTDYTGPFEVPRLGDEVVVEYRSTDTSGNEEAINRLTIAYEATAGETFDVAARDNFFDPDDLDAAVGDSVRWRFDQAAAVHDVWIKPPGQPEVHVSAASCSGGYCEPGADPITYALDAPGDYPFYCKLHAGDAQGKGMAGVVRVFAAAE